MPPSSRREPTIELRRHRRTDGSESELWSVRWYDAHGRLGDRQEPRRVSVGPVRLEGKLEL